MISELDALLAGGPGAALRLLVEDRRASAALAPELVWSGPDATEQLRDTSVVMRQLFAEANREVLVSGFVVVDGARVFEELARRMDAVEELEIRLFLNVAAERGVTDHERLRTFAREVCGRQWPGRRRPKFYYDPRALEPDRKRRASLHAKAVVVDRATALVTSANLTPYAQTRNIELGVLLRSAELATRVAEQFDALVEHKHVLRLPGT